MADNLTVTAGTGTTVSTDQVGTAHYQRVKVTDGTADSENHLVVDSSGNAMVKNAAGSALIGKVSIDQSTANANEVVVKSGTVTAVTAITNALPAGTNVLGYVNASQVTSPWLTNASVVNVHQVNASQLTSPWITNASVVNTPIAVNASQVTSPWLTNASIVNANFAVNASQLTSPWLTNASVVNVAQVNASQLTSPWLTNASVVNVHQVNASQLTSPWITNASVVNGISASQVEDFIVKQAFVQNTADFAASATACAIWTPGSGKKFAITDLIVSTASAGTLTIFDHADGTASRVAKLNLAANGGAVINYRKPRISSTADYVLKYTASNTAVGSITVSGYEV
jgi:hypothetical protein